MNYKLTESQQSALEKIRKRFEDPNRKQLFKLYGSAGTGKSFLINVIVTDVLAEQLDISEIAFCAPTGKAASVILQRFAYDNVSTIHRLIYHIDVVKKPVEYDENGMPIKFREEIRFFKKSELEDIKLIVVDEFSMVSPELLSDLMSYKLPIIALGDPYQLPPVNGQHINANDCDAILTEIVRQHEDNQIIRIANDIKNGGILQYGNYNDQVIVLDKRQLSNKEYFDLLLGADQIICGLNRTKDRINSEIRKVKGMRSILPQIGDKLICKLNNYGIEFDKYTLTNGIIGTCTDYMKLNNGVSMLSFEPDFYILPIENLICDNGIFEHNEYYYPLRQQVYNMGFCEYVPKRSFTRAEKKNPNYKKLAKEEYRNKLNALSIETLNRFEYAYAISCHASQGSEFDTVVVIDESFAFPDSKKERLYTALTRAKEKVIVIR